MIEKKGEIPYAFLDGFDDLCCAATPLVVWVCRDDVREPSLPLEKGIQ